MKTAIVLFNLGGPDGPEAVQPFLFNLFSDPAIIGLPQPLRWLVATLISKRRAPVAREIYGRIGGRSPIKPLTEEQARALEAELGPDCRAFIAMRYWHPRADATARDIKAWGPDRIVLLPLYPQFSTTTTASSIKEWHEAAARAGLSVPTSTIGCYPVLPELARAQAALIAPAFARAAAHASVHGKPRILLSAHGLPEKVVKGGDPYQWQVEQSAAAVMAELAASHQIRDADWLVCYQSRVGPLKWIGPATDLEIDRAGKDRVPLVVVPIAFVSEHSETLVELDIEYAHRARDAGVPHYERVPALGTTVEFIKGLARLVQVATKGAPGQTCRADGATRNCPPQFGACPCKTAA